jgi:hypothetical protein
MAKSRPSVQKRIKEAKKIQKAQDKALRKAARIAQRADPNYDPTIIDPYLLGLDPDTQELETDEPSAE